MLETHPPAEKLAPPAAAAPPVARAIENVDLKSRLKTIGGWNRRRLMKWAEIVTQINSLEPGLKQLDHHQLRKHSLALKYRAKSKEPLDKLLPEAFALVREAAFRALKMRHFDVQMLGGIAMFNRSIAEMETGEGKTLTATLAMYLHSLAGRSCQLATVNDYLARRDADWMKPVYDLLGVSVGVIETEMTQPQRRKAYECDVTYGTAKEFGFDFLRDRLLLRRISEGQTDFLAAMLGEARGGGGGEKPVQRDAYFCLVDEADNILIDDARTPLIISALPSEEQKIAVECYAWAAEVQDKFVEDEHYEYDHEKKKVELNAGGRRLVRQLVKPDAMDRVGMYHIYEYIERAIKVGREFYLDRHYVVRDGEIVIVDESTGRLAEGRKWRAGIHQAVEAKQGVEVTVETGQAARITVQDYFLRYENLGGMTGTARTSARELKKIYKLNVVQIPTNLPSQRERLPDAVFGTQAAKWDAIANEIREIHAQGRPILVGTRTIEKSELLARMLNALGIEHHVLNANKIAEEADIVARGGLRGRVTVSTNMAGRGTDIKLGPGVAELGGLHVICTELHDSARIDRQLVGRCARQGDPGTVQQFMAFEDDVFENAYGPKKAERRFKAWGRNNPGLLSTNSNSFYRAQRKVERKHFRDRRILMHHEKERKKMQVAMGQDPYLDTAGG
jgi:preprotein translocase subunit SecA